MGYEIPLQARILALLHLFNTCAPDQEIHACVTELVADKAKWHGAHDLFSLIRKRALVVKKYEAGRAIVLSDPVEIAKVAQYSFEELCLKTIYNETDTNCPFDTNSSFWVAGSAIKFAKKLGLPAESVIAIIAPDA